jgi:hypothetical protein
VIINGGSRKNGAFFAKHLMRADHNERVAVVELRGLIARTVAGAFRELEAIAGGTRITNYFYHASVSPDTAAQLTAEQWAQAVDTLEKALGFTGQPRLIVEHTKQGRTHRHVIWSRIDADSMRALPDALTYRKHERAAREIEQALGHQVVASVLMKDRKTPRPPRPPAGWETMRGQASNRDPKAMTAELTALWHAAGDGTAFAAALQARGYILARGDRRDFVLIDPHGDDHSLARRISGVKAAEIRTRMADIDPTRLPTVAEARAIARQGSGGGTAVAPPTPATARAQVRAAARVVSRPAPDVRGRRSAPQRVSLPRFATATDAAMAAEQVRAMAQLLVASIELLGHVPQIVADLVDDGRHWWERTAQHITNLAEEAHDTLRGWRDALHLS